jgi:eukaryotic-like serine/threonine-protein kinase
MAGSNRVATGQRRRIVPYCQHCGAGVEEQDSFCESCGGALEANLSAQPADSNHLGNYVLVGVIGRGATGTVYLATDNESGHQVALKVLDPVLAHLPGYPERLHSESVVLSQLSDPHLVATFGVGQDQGHLFLVMEYVEGASLRAVEQQAGRLTPEQALGLIAGALQGLGFAHAHGLVHGDVKPENIVVDRAGTSKLVDFGQVVSTGATTLGGTRGPL